MVKWYSCVATWDKDVLSQVKTIIYDWVSINDYVPYKKVYNGSNYARPSPDFLKEMFYMNEDEIIFVYIGLYGKLPKTISRYTIDTHDVYTYVYTATWSDCGTRQVIRKQKVGSERFSEVCYDWEIDNIDLFRAAFNRHEGG